MSRIIVVGSGASGVHFALTALQKGHEVTLLDVGGTRPAPPRPTASFSNLKDTLPDPAAYFLGECFEGVVLPGTRDTFYGFPPSKAYVFREPKTFSYRASGINPYFTFARGGFAETWTAGAYSFNDDDLEEFPFGYAELRAPYQEVARRIGICAEDDDLSRFMPIDAEYLPPLKLDGHSKHLIAAYHRHRLSFHSQHGWYLGRSRVATLSRAYAGRQGCDQLGRCLWGCPNQAIYTPALTLLECMRDPRFEYVSGVLVTHFEIDASGCVGAVQARSLESGQIRSFEGDFYVSAAGTLMSAKIFLDTVYRATGDVVRLGGLMDNRQIHVPFLSPGMIGQPAPTDSYQFHHLAFGLVGTTARDYVHGQITTLKAAAIHPIAQALPFDLHTSLEVFRRLRAGLAIANVNLYDERRVESSVSISPGENGGDTALVIDYASGEDEPARIRSALKRVNRAIRKLGGFVPPGMTRILPKGTSVHYAGTLPMSRSPMPLTCSAAGRSHDFANLIIADASTFPFLPAKNHTFTLMANAVRMAEALP